MRLERRAAAETPITVVSARFAAARDGGSWQVEVADADTTVHLVIGDTVSGRLGGSRPDSPPPGRVK